ncbi:MAG: BrnT family toxin [Proteobacteria bacterium]|nr:BrnT family toxin [Pseudomonadota bacterium]
MAINYNFEWDPIKARNNRDKHAVTFDEAASVFRDSKALSIFDPEHSETEDRWITLGISEKGRLLIVIHTFKEDSKEAATIRIISCRKATNHEGKTYGEKI